jgi:hypothetical protein
MRSAVILSILAVVFVGCGPTQTPAAIRWRVVTVHDGDTVWCWVTFTTARRVPVEVAAAFVRECPHVVRGTFKPT